MFCHRLYGTMGGITLVWLSSCQVGPDYKRPSFDLPKHFTNQPPSSSKIVAQSPEALWFEHYRDPVLIALIQEGMRSNRDVQIACARIREARASLLGSNAAFSPMIQGKASYLHGQNSQNTLNGSEEFANLYKKVPNSAKEFINQYLNVPNGQKESTNLYQTQLDSSWELDLWGGLRRNKEAVIASLESSEEALRNMQLSLSAEIAIQYITLRSHQDQLRVTQAAVKSWETVCSLNQALLQAGKVTDIEIQRAQSSRDQIRATLSTLQATIQASMHRLAILLGLQPTALYCRLASISPIPTLPDTVFAGLPSELLKRRPDIRQAERALHSATAQIGATRANLFPKFFLTGQMGLQSDNGSHLLQSDSLMHTIGSNISWSIFDFGRIRSAVQSKEAARDAQTYQYEQTILHALEDVENALVRYTMERQRFEQLRQAFQASRSAVETCLHRYQSGLMNYLNVSAAELAAHSNHLALLQSQTILAMQSVALCKALGGGL